MYALLTLTIPADWRCVSCNSENGPVHVRDLKIVPQERNQPKDTMTVGERRSIRGSPSILALAGPLFRFAFTAMKSPVGEVVHPVRQIDLLNSAFL